MQDVTMTGAQTRRITTMLPNGDIEPFEHVATPNAIAVVQDGYRYVFDADGYCLTGLSGPVGRR
jgi:hypothetical protein